MMMAAESMDWIGQLLVETQERGVAGEVIECGCHNGITSLYMQSVIVALKLGRQLHCYDAFQPLVPSDRPQEKGDPGYAHSSLERFEVLFLDWDVIQPIAHRGFFSGTIPDGLPEKVCFALLDCDFYAPMCHLLKHVLPRVPPKGYVVIHDYRQEKWGLGVRQAVAENWRGPVIEDKGLAVLVKV